MVEGDVISTELSWDWQRKFVSPATKMIFLSVRLQQDFIAIGRIEDVVGLLDHRIPAIMGKQLLLAYTYGLGCIHVFFINQIQ